MLQHDKNLGIIAKSIENKIKNELSNMMKNDYEEYKNFFKIFGLQLKFGIYNNYGMDKDKLKDLILFYSANKKDLISLKEYVSNMSENQDKIYYANGETPDKIDLLPQVELVKDKGFDILYFTDYMDEFAIQTLMEYEGKKFINVCSKDLNLSSDEENKKLDKLNSEHSDLFKAMKESLADSVSEVRFTNRLKSHPVCLTTEGDVSVEMEKVFNAMPTDNKLNVLYKNDKDELAKYTKILYAQARLIEGLTIDNPTEISNLVCDLISK